MSACAELTPGVVRRHEKQCEADGQSRADEPGSRLVLFLPSELGRSRGAEDCRDRGAHGGQRGEQSGDRAAHQHADAQRSEHLAIDDVFRSRVSRNPFQGDSRWRHEPPRQRSAQEEGEPPSTCQQSCRQIHQRQIDDGRHVVGNDSQSEVKLSLFDSKAIAFDGAGRVENAALQQELPQGANRAADRQQYRFLQAGRARANDGGCGDSGGKAESVEFDHLFAQRYDHNHA